MKKQKVGAIIVLVAVLLSACGADKTPPEINCASDQIEIMSGGSVEDLRQLFSASDDKDGDITSKIEIDDSSLDYDTVGEYSFTVSVQDEAGNVTSDNYSATVVANPEDVLTGIEAMFSAAGLEFVILDKKYDVDKNIYTVSVDDTKLDEALEKLTELSGLNFYTVAKMIVDKRCKQIYEEAIPPVVDRVFEYYNVKATFGMDIYYKAFVADRLVFSYEDGKNTFDKLELYSFAG